MDFNYIFDVIVPDIVEGDLVVDEVPRDNYVRFYRVLRDDDFRVLRDDDPGVNCLFVYKVVTIDGRRHQLGLQLYCGTGYPREGEGRFNVGCYGLYD